jgi:hypothetical protein
MDYKKRQKMLVYIAVLTIGALAFYFISGLSKGGVEGLEIKGGASAQKELKDFRLDTEIFKNEKYNQLKKLDASDSEMPKAGNKNPFEQTGK